MNAKLEKILIDMGCLASELENEAHQKELGTLSVELYRELKRLSSIQYQVEYATEVTYDEPKTVNEN